VEIINKIKGFMKFKVSHSLILKDIIIDSIDSMFDCINFYLLFRDIIKYLVIFRYF